MKTVERIRVADEAWIALALLHREHPDRESFTAKEIMDRIRSARLSSELRSGLQVHIYLHNVANLPPNSAQYRMFYRLENRTYRLFRPGDDWHPARSGKIRPDPAELPAEYRHLIDWYEKEYSRGGSGQFVEDPVLLMRGVGKHLWEAEGSDAFIARERAAWEAEAPDPDPTVSPPTPAGAATSVRRNL